MKNILIYLLLMILTSSVAFAQNKANEDFSISVQKEGSSGSPFSQSKFVPDISLILDASYVWRSIKDEKINTLSSPEFTHAMSEEDAHENMNSRNGFNFNYAELTFYSVVDPYFDLFAVCHFSKDGAEIEEGYFTTTALPYGFQLKGGNFLSHFGRINEQHAHYWDFAEIPLAYQTFFGAEGLNETGGRLTWVAPIDFYLMFGSEVLMGSNETTFGNEGFTSADGSVNVKGNNGPNLSVSYVKTSFDMGDLVVLAGASGAFGRTRINHGIDISGEEGHAMQGKSYVLGGDLTLKYQIDSIRFLSLQSEYLYRNMKGSLYEKDAADAVSESDIDKKQSGFYSQLVGKFSKRWRIGLRYDLLQLNDVKENGSKKNLPDNLPRYSAMTDYNPTEFSRIRLQYNCDMSKYETAGDTYSRKINHEVFLQINLAIGAHGAHSF
ncbi:MAG: hypothetical protein V1874_05065 [Spirochaetota bacterium]